MLSLRLLPPALVLLLLAGGLRSKFVRGPETLARFDDVLEDGMGNILPICCSWCSTLRGMHIYLKSLRNRDLDDKVFKECSDVRAHTPVFRWSVDLEWVDGGSGFVTLQKWGWSAPQEHFLLPNSFAIGNAAESTRRATTIELPFVVNSRRIFADDRLF